MAFPPSFIDELVARNPIEEVVGQYVTLKPICSVCVPSTGRRRHLSLLLPTRVSTIALAAIRAAALSIS